MMIRFMEPEFVNARLTKVYDEERLKSGILNEPLKKSGEDISQT